MGNFHHSSHPHSMVGNLFPMESGTCFFFLFSQAQYTVEWGVSWQSIMDGNAAESP